jgi:hypothetical protein
VTSSKEGVPTLQPGLTTAPPLLQSLLKEMEREFRNPDEFPAEQISPNAVGGAEDVANGRPEHGLFTGSAPHSSRRQATLCLSKTVH